MDFTQAEVGKNFPTSADLNCYSKTLHHKRLFDIYILIKIKVAFTRRLQCFKNFFGIYLEVMMHAHESKRRQILLCHGTAYVCLQV